MKEVVKCPNCRSEWSIDDLIWAIDKKGLRFLGYCPKCSKVKDC